MIEAVRGERGEGERETGAGNTGGMTVGPDTRSTFASTDGGKGRNSCSLHGGWR
jgi:hypothetical protein